MTEGRKKVVEWEKGTEDVGGANEGMKTRMTTDSDNGMKGIANFIENLDTHYLTEEISWNDNTIPTVW